MSASFAETNVRKITETEDVPMGNIVAGAKAIVVVNVASEWGLTDKHYRQYNEMFSANRDRGLIIVAFPCNQFGGQEPHPEQHIKDWIAQNYSCEFPIMSKVDVNGENACALY